MTTSIVQSSGENKGGGRERAGVFALAGAIVTIVVLYLVLNQGSSDDSARGLLPYQALAGTLPESDREQFRAIRDQLLSAETQRVRTK